MGMWKDRVNSGMKNGSLEGGFRAGVVVGGGVVSGEVLRFLGGRRGGGGGGGFFFNDAATTEVYALSLHDAHPILSRWPVSTAARSKPPEARS